jgi:poly-gamma-glutamate synthesis protein (capsule biosynthesis protein)
MIRSVSQPVIPFFLLLCLAFPALTAGCVVQAPPAVEANPLPQPVPTQPAPTPTQPPEPVLFLSPQLPDGLVDQILFPANWAVTSQPEAANMTINISPENPHSLFIYALAAPFNTIEDSLSTAELTSIWQGQTTDDLDPLKLLVSPQTKTVLEVIWGPASPQVLISYEEDLLAQAWQEDQLWAILPFEELEPGWKVMEIDGQSPIRKDFDPAAYALGIPVSIHLGTNADPAWLEAIDMPDSNRDPALLTTVNLTGVTALVRATAAMMELRGYTYPAQSIRNILREADITHVNNEVPFTERCPKPGAPTDSLVFCSRPEYIQLLEDIGTDVVELSGDHFQDWGPEAVLETLDMYKQRNWPYYGGGENLEDAQQPALFEINGNKIAFLGCNAKPRGYSGATETSPGAMHCEMDWMEDQVRQLRQQGYLPIVTFQHLEYYSYHIHPILQEDFQKMAKAGAVIVSGSQSHQPHGIELTRETFMHYGLGNLFFDQYYESLETRQAFIDRHVFYNGRYISTELLSIVFTDYAHSEPMSLEERQALLETVFKASQWEWLATAEID